MDVAHSSVKQESFRFAAGCPHGGCPHAARCGPDMLVTRRPALITADVQIVPSQGAHSVGTQRPKPTWVLAHSRGIGECIRIELGEPAAKTTRLHDHTLETRQS